MDRQLYYNALKDRLEPNILNHSLALEACMLGIYDYLKSQNQLPDSEPTRQEWGMAGLIHDIDFSLDTKELHPARTREVAALYNLEVSDIVYELIQDHDARSGKQPRTKAGWAIRCADSLTGLITAVAFVYPSRKLADVKTSSVLKRFLKEPRFAAGTRRDEVILCEKEDGLNIKIDKFIEICLQSMQKIAPELGL